MTIWNFADKHFSDIACLLIIGFNGFLFARWMR